jgi:hypothetical protein
MGRGGIIHHNTRCMFIILKKVRTYLKPSCPSCFHCSPLSWAPVLWIIVINHNSWRPPWGSWDSSTWDRWRSDFSLMTRWEISVYRSLSQGRSPSQTPTASHRHRFKSASHVRHNLNLDLATLGGGGTNRIPQGIASDTTRLAAPRQHIQSIDHP